MEESAEPWLRRVLELRPDHEPGQLWLAQIRLEKLHKVLHDPSIMERGTDLEVETLERLVDSSNSIVANSAIQTLRRHYARFGMREELDRVDYRSDRLEQIAIDVYRELGRMK